MSTSKQQRAIRTPAIILRRRDRGEADRLVTVLTPLHGKRDVVAYGARKLTSRTTGHVELFTLADMLLNLHKDPGSIAQVELVEPFLPLRDDLTLGAYASYTTELLDRFTQMGEDDLRVLFALLRDTFARLCSATDPRLVLRYYEVHLLGEVGFRPELHTCVLSGATVRPENQYFSFAEGGVVCPEYGASNPNLAGISFQSLKLLRHMQRSRYEQVGSLKIPQAVHNELEALLLGYITYTLEQQLQSAEFIRRLRRMGA